jgi:hypothetical protein
MVKMRDRGSTVMIQKFWQRLISTRYVRALEGEVERLRAENRALLNSILGIAGVPPIPVSREELGASGDASLAREERKVERSLKRTIQSNQRGIQTAGPMRRRSWQQINRSLEFESAQKKENGDGDGVALPVARKG